MYFWRSGSSLAINSAFAHGVNRHPRTHTHTHPYTLMTRRAKFGELCELFCQMKCLKFERNSQVYIDVFIIVLMIYRKSYIIDHYSICSDKCSVNDFQVQNLWFLVVVRWHSLAFRQDPWLKVSWVCGGWTWENFFLKHDAPRRFRNLVGALIVEWRGTLATWWYPKKSGL